LFVGGLERKDKASNSWWWATCQEAGVECDGQQSLTAAELKWCPSYFWIITNSKNSNYAGATRNLQPDVHLDGFINCNIICSLVCVSISFPSWRFLLTIFEAIETGSANHFRDKKLYKAQGQVLFWTKHIEFPGYGVSNLTSIIISDHTRPSI
jgi:hypothetical protein